MKRTAPPPSARIRRLLPLAAACALAVATPGSLRCAPIEEHRPVCIRGTCFDAEIAVTEAERARGLMQRAALPRNRGMLFVFPEPGPHHFWMKNTLIELDIVFIGPDRRVVSIAHRAQPCRTEPCATYGPAADAAYALEIGGGLARAMGFTAGDLVEFRESTAGH